MKNLKWYHYAIAVLIILLALSNCNKGGGFFSCGHGNDTVSVKTEKTGKTTEVLIINGPPIPFVIEVPKPGKPVPGKPVIKWLKSDPEIIHDTLPPLIDYAYALAVDTAAILQAYFAKLYYADSQRFDHGYLSGFIKINDTVSQNRIIGRSTKISVTDSLEKKTVTLRAKQKLVGYFGLSWQGFLTDPFYAGGIDFSLKGRNDRIFGVGVSLTHRSDGTGILNKNKFLFKGEMKIPIRLFPGLSRIGGQ